MNKIHKFKSISSIWSIKFYSFEKVGHPLDQKTFIDEKTVSVVRPLQRSGAAGPNTDQWMEGLAAAELLMHSA